MSPHALSLLREHGSVQSDCKYCLRIRTYELKMQSNETHAETSFKDVFDFLIFVGFQGIM